MNHDPKDACPMLSGQYNKTKQRFPVYVQPKYDGIRALCMSGRPYSRSMKLIPNQFVNQWFEIGKEILSDIDGELIVGEPTDEHVFRKTSSGVMSREGQPDFRFYAFDIHSKLPFEDRLQKLEDLFDKFKDSEISQRLKLAPTTLVVGYESLDNKEAEFVDAGYEGIMLRSPAGLYKYGRSTTNGGELIKLKRFTDNEAQVIGFEELQHNNNEAFQNETGHQKRSAHQENMVAGGMLGALIAKSDKCPEFRVGSGFDHSQRKEIWDNRQRYLNQTFTYKEFLVGGYDKPRHPIFKHWRQSGY